MSMEGHPIHKSKRENVTDIGEARERRRRATHKIATHASETPKLQTDAQILELKHTHKKSHEIPQEDPGDKFIAAILNQETESEGSAYKDLEEQTIKKVHEYLKDDSDSAAAPIRPPAGVTQLKKVRARTRKPRIMQSPPAAPASDAEPVSFEKESKKRRKRVEHALSSQSNIGIESRIDSQSDEALTPEQADALDRARRREKDPEGEFQKEKAAIVQSELDRMIADSKLFSFDESIRSVEPEKALACIRNLQRAIIEAEYGWVLQSELTTKSTQISIHEHPPAIDLHEVKKTTEGGPVAVKLDISTSETDEDIIDTVDNAGRKIFAAANSEKGTALKINELTRYLQGHFKVEIASRFEKKDSKIAAYLERVHGAIRSLAPHEQAQLESIKIHIPEGNGNPFVLILKFLHLMSYSARADGKELYPDFKASTETIADGLRKCLALKDTQH